MRRLEIDNYVFYCNSDFREQESSARLLGLVR
jgi:hypothetical protein